jgi:hypothetical protein
LQRLHEAPHVHPVGQAVVDHEVNGHDRAV